MIKLFKISIQKSLNLKRTQIYLKADKWFVSKKIRKGSLIVFFLLLVIDSKGDQLCPNSRLLGGCSIVNGCIYNSLNGNLVVCGDNSHYYEASGDFDWLGRENFLFVTLPLDDYIMLFGVLPTIYAFIKLKKESVLK